MEGDSPSQGEPLSWEDIPLLKYECELLVRSGAWKSLLELEESLTLDELFLLYRAANNDVSMQLKVAAAAQGAEVDWDDDWYDPEPPKPPEVLEGGDLRFIPIGLGYES